MTSNELTELLPYLTEQELAELDKLLKSEPLTFREFIRTVAPHVQFYAHVERLIDVLQRVADGTLKRLMISMPPRHGKSEIASRLFTAYYLYRHPHQFVGVASYGASLAYTLSRSARENYRASGSELATEGVEMWETVEGGGLWAAGVGGPITGKGAYLLLVDDPVKNAEEAASPTFREKQKEWWRSTFYTRQEPDAAIVVIQTRWHEDDLSGWLLAQEVDADSEPEHWHIMCMPAMAEPLPPFPASCTVEPDERAVGEPLCPERYPLPKLERIKANVGDEVWGSLYQQRPRSAEGDIFNWGWWDGRNRYNIDDSRVRNKVIGRWQFWDTALKDDTSNDPSACMTFELWPDYRIAVRFVFNERLQSAFLPDKIREFAERWNYDGKLQAVVIEDKSSGTTAIQTLRATAPEWLATIIQEFQPHGTKEYRGRQAAIWCARDCILLPHPSEAAPWLYNFADPQAGQLFRFPKAAHDDMVDAFSMGIIYTEHLLSMGWQAREGLVQSE